MTVPQYSPEFLRVSNNLLGQDVSNLSPEKLDRYRRMLYDFNMGHYTAKTMTPFSSVAFQKSESAFYHPLSITETAKRYGFNKLEEIIPMDTYLKLPAFMVDEFIEGITEGKKNRFEVDKRKAAENPEAGDKGGGEIASLTALLQNVLQAVSKAK